MSGGKKERQKNMTFTKSVFVFAFVVAALLTVTVGLGGPAHVAMLIAAIVAGIVAVGSGYSWNELQDGIGDTIKAADGRPAGYFSSASPGSWGPRRRGQG